MQSYVRSSGICLATDAGTVVFIHEGGVLTKSAQPDLMRTNSDYPHSDATAMVRARNGQALAQKNSSRSR